MHRVPIPEGLVRALVVLAWQLGWFSWVGITLIAYFGAGRVGEILHCKRQDLVFASDLLDKNHESIYLQLKRFKSLGRQAAHVQHMEIRDSGAVKILRSIYEHCPKSTMLFGGSPSFYRRRWDALLAMFSVPSELKLTPGGLRGGAAVMLYRQRVPVQDILWRLRLRSQTTLESYLQETAACAVFSSLGPEVTDRLFRVGALFELLA